VSFPSADQRGTDASVRSVSSDPNYSAERSRDSRLFFTRERCPTPLESGDVIEGPRRLRFPRDRLESVGLHLDRYLNGRRSSGGIRHSNTPLEGTKTRERAGRASLSPDLIYSSPSEDTSLSLSLYLYLYLYRELIRTHIRMRKRRANARDGPSSSTPRRGKLDDRLR